MSLEDLLGGTERYAQLASLFQPVVGPQGPDGTSNTLIARETRRKLAIGKNLTYSGFIHTIAAGELAPDNDTIGFVFWYLPDAMTSVLVRFFWNTPTPFEILRVNSNNYQMISVMLSAGPASNADLIATTLNTWPFPSTTRVVDVGEDWMNSGGSISASVTTTGGVPPATVNMAVHYYAMQK